MLLKPNAVPFRVIISASKNSLKNNFAYFRESFILNRSLVFFLWDMSEGQTGMRVATLFWVATDSYSIWAENCIVIDPHIINGKIL